jgi:hypothetical protein
MQSMRDVGTMAGGCVWGPPRYVADPSPRHGTQANPPPLLFSLASIQSRVDITVGEQVRREVCVVSN